MLNFVNRLFKVFHCEHQFLFGLPPIDEQCTLKSLSSR